jgi:hypothetical protein
MDYKKRLQEIVDANNFANAEAEAKNKSKGEVAVKFLEELRLLLEEVNNFAGKEYFDIKDFQIEKARERGCVRMLFIFWGNYSKYFTVRVKDDYLPYFSIANTYGEYPNEVKGIDNAVELVLKFVKDNLNIEDSKV